jgi:hypothetical protein
MWYILLFSGIAILLVVAGSMTISRNRRELDSDPTVHGRSDAYRHQRKAQRTQSKNARRKRH